MLTAEQNFFLEIMKSSVNDTKLESIPNDIDWDVLLNIAQIQQMTALLYSRIAKELQNMDDLKEIDNRLINAYSASLLWYQKRIALLNRIKKCFADADIPFFVFKGTELSQFYNDPAIRTMGDSDVLVHEEDREKAHEIFLQLGMENSSKSENEWIYFYDNMEFELHCRLMNEGEVGNYQSHKNFMNRIWEYANNQDGSIHYHLDISYHFVFVLLHLRKHFINSGVGFRQFMDLAVMMKKCELDWQWIQNEIELLGLTQFSKTCFAFCERWFGISAPIEYETLDEEFYEFSTKKIFNNGVFGFDDKENKNNYTILQLRENKTKGKISVFFQFFFPSYSSIKNSPKYSFLNAKPWLLPIAWIYRFSYSIFHGTAVERTSRINDKINISENQISKRKEYLENWGLD